ncbi:MAG: metallophosphoesterase family protein [Myxococcales bacterium]|nr:metallophosphoesterase family protein [Myxococcales bacterium]
MRVGIIADVHANLAALEATLSALERLDVAEIICLGDVVGYHARPGECIERVAETCARTVAGNHDRDVLTSEPREGTRAVARQVQSWTREQLAPAQLEWLAALPNRVVHRSGFVAVHGCYLNEHHFTGYVTSTMIPANLERVAACAEWPRVALVGHTHSPICAWLHAGRVVEERNAASRWPDVASAVLLNPGSVGQPRDGDPRASFGVLDVSARLFEIHRVEYDVASTVAELDSAGLPCELGERLRTGR